jgi:16S rRNA processing protein RimM
MGRVAAPHGVRGAVKVLPLSANPASLLEFREWWMRPSRSNGWAVYRVRTSRMQAGMIVGEFEGVETRDAAGALRGADVGVPREALPGLAAGEHYQADLAGMTVVNRAGETLGAVAGFVESGAHPIVRVVDAAGLERLIPWVAQFVLQVDVAARRIDVDWAQDY